MLRPALPPPQDTERGPNVSSRGRRFPRTLRNELPWHTSVHVRSRPGCPDAPGPTAGAAEFSPQCSVRQWGSVSPVWRPSAVSGRPPRCVFFWPNILTEPPNRFRVGFPGDYPSDHVETRFKEQHGVWVVNGVYNGRRQIYALSTICTHLGCITLWLDGEQKFKCPCHGSGFYPDGINYEGPAPRPLERYAIRVGDDGQLEVDKSKRFQEELGQWSDPDCFIPV